MKITDVKVFPVDEDKLKAYATITFDNCFIVRDLKVISGNKGYFIAMPSKKRKDGTFRDVAHPLNSETRKMIEESVLEVYERENVSSSTPAAYQDDDAMDKESTGVDIEGSVLESEEIEEDTLESTAHEVDPVEEDPDEGTYTDSSPDTDKNEDSEIGTAAETVEDEPAAEPVEPTEPVESEDKEKGAEENPVIEQSDDPEKAFGYEE